MKNEKFRLFTEELLKWNKSINLIQKKTASSIEERHIVDSLQLREHIDYENDVVVDIGSGAGFPGIILAIDGAKAVHLVEPTNKKTVFLNHIKQLYGLPVSIHECGWEKMNLFNATVITSRAFASLDTLLAAMTHVSRETKMAKGIFLKGEKIQEELIEADKNWSFKKEIVQSTTCEKGCVLKVWDVKKK